MGLPSGASVFSAGSSSICVAGANVSGLARAVTNADAWVAAGSCESAHRRKHVSCAPASALSAWQACQSRNVAVPLTGKLLQEMVASEPSDLPIGQPPVPACKEATSESHGLGCPGRVHRSVAQGSLVKVKATSGASGTALWLVSFQKPW